MNLPIIIKQIFSYLPILFFILIAGHHFYLVHNQHLSPWLGGGYGMFSSTDYGPSRFIKILGLKDNIIQEEVEIPEHLSALGQQVRSLPNNKNIQHLAIELENYFAFNQHVFPVIRVEIWKTLYDSQTLKPSYQKLNTIEHKTGH